MTAPATAGAVLFLRILCFYDQDVAEAVEGLYREGEGGKSTVPWADARPNPQLVEFWDAHAFDTARKSALVIAGGLGDGNWPLGNLRQRHSMFRRRRSRWRRGGFRIRALPTS